MHPPLTPGNHPLCLHVIADLKNCHEQHPWGKLLGACNTQKWALDACFRAEKQVKRKANHDKAKREQERLAARRTAAGAAGAS